ncbi:MAG: LytR/AlgR family response regulator transcription factor [Terrimicrobiaceae bacterium]
MLRVILVDDEPLARQGLRDLLTARPEVEVAGEADCVENARTLIQQVRPDGIFLDVRMPEADGFELLTSLKECPPVIFVTAYSEYAVRAFEVQAVDYLLKPVRPKRLSQAIIRLQAALGTPETDQNPYGTSDRICLRTPEKTLVAPLADIIALQADKDFTRVTVADTPPLMICQSLGVYERNLPNPPFLRVDRSTILNLTRIHSIEISPSRGARVFLNGSVNSFPLGRAALRRLRLAIPQYLSNMPSEAQ